MKLDRKRVLAIALLTASPLSLIVGGTPAAAQERSYDIKAQPLASAILEFSRQSNVAVLAPMELVRGKRAPALRGAYSPAEALQKLLAGSGLRAVRGADGGMSLVPVGNGPTGGQAASGTGDIAGSVVDANTGRKLVGALVRVGSQSAVTDEQGRFRLTGVPAGADKMVVVSFIGLTPQERLVTVTRGEGVAVDFALGVGEDIIVYGTKSARALALNRERTAENSSTVVSADLLGDFGGQTISETLRRAPGITFSRDALTGDGTNVTVRGLAPDLNAVKLNGIELPVGDGRGRSASLGNIQTESIDRVTINKTLLPNHDSAGAGGLVEIETKSPLDRARRFASVSVEGGQRARGFNDEFSASGTLSARVGASENFGVSASVQYQRRTIRRLGESAAPVFGNYLPLGEDGTASIYAIDMVDPRLRFPLEPGAADAFAVQTGANSDLTRATSLTATLSAAWTPSETTVLRFDYQTNRKDDTQFTRTSDMASPSYYVPAPVPSLGGEIRNLLTTSGEVQVSGFYEYTPFSKTNTDVATFHAQSKFGKLDANLTLGYTVGSRRDTRIGLFSTSGEAILVDPASIRPDAVDPVEGHIPTLIGTRGRDGIAQLLLTDAGLAFLNSPERYLFSSIRIQPSQGRNSRAAADGSLRYNFDGGMLRYLEAGFQFEESRFRNTPLDSLAYISFTGVPLPRYGLTFDDAILSPIGRDTAFGALSFEALKDFVLRGAPAVAVAADDPSRFDPGVIYRAASTYDPIFSKQRTREREIAGYVQARLDIGKLEIIGGARFSNIAIDAINLAQPIIVRPDFSSDDDFARANTELRPERATQFNILPRVVANYRIGNDIVIRGGYFLSIARPQISLLSSGSNAILYLPPFFGPTFNQPLLSVFKGNPDLKPAKTHSFDMSFEYYDKTLGVAKLNLFYKRIDNLLENNVRSTIAALEGVELPDDPRFDAVLADPAAYHIEVSIPTNNPSPAHIWGAELEFERRLTFLPAPLDGLGLFGNYTYSKSSKDQPYTWSFSPVRDADGNIVGTTTETIVERGVSFVGQPRHSGTMGMSYSRGGIDARLSYTAQSRRIVTNRPYGLSEFERGYGTLDARIEYRLPASWPGDGRIYLEGYDLLRGARDASLVTEVGEANRFVYGAQYFGGRQIRAGLSISF